MRVLVTGGAGFIGSHLCEALVHQGHQVTVLDDLSTGRFENIEHISGLTCVVDTTLNKDIVRDLVREADVVYHLAATVGVQLVVEQPVRTLVNNIRGTETVLEETSRYRRRLLITSSSEVYGKGMNPEFRETDDRIMGATSLSRWGYAASKAMDEFLALAYWYEKRHPVVIVRLFNTVGTRQTGRYGMVIPRFVAQALRNEPLTVFGDGEQSRCFTYVGDVVPALIKLMERRDLCGEVFNIGSGQGITVSRLLQTMQDVGGDRRPMKQGPADWTAGSCRVADISKAREQLGWRPTTGLREGLERTFQFLRDEQPG